MSATHTDEKGWDLLVPGVCSAAEATLGFTLPQ